MTSRKIKRVIVIACCFDLFTYSLFQIYNTNNIATDNDNSPAKTVLNIYNFLCLFALVRPLITSSLMATFRVCAFLFACMRLNASVCVDVCALVSVCVGSRMQCCNLDRTCDRPVLVSMQCTCLSDLEVRFYCAPEGLLRLRSRTQRPVSVWQNVLKLKKNVYFARRALSAFEGFLRGFVRIFLFAK